MSAKKEIQAPHDALKIFYEMLHRNDFFGNTIDFLQEGDQKAIWLLEKTISCQMFHKTSVETLH